VTDDHTPDSKQPGAGWEVSRRHFIYGSAAAVGAATVLGRVPPLRPRAALASRASGPLSPVGGWTKVQASAPQSGRGQVSLGLPQGASTTGTLLVVTVLSPNTDPAFSFQPPRPRLPPPRDGSGDSPCCAQVAGSSSGIGPTTPAGFTQG
jgi:hypothetical protein